MIKCEICGHESKYRLIEHIQRIHKMNVDEYKNQYGPVVSEEYRKKVSDKAKKKWKEDEYRQKTMDSRSWIYSDEELNDRRINSIKQYYKDGGKVWNDGLTKDKDQRVAFIGDFNKKNLSGRTKENYEYLKNKSELMYSLWESSNLKKKREEISNDPIKNREYKNKISKTLTNKILTGEINPFSNFKSGWYENEKGKHWYSSGLELESMKLMDELKIHWSKNNKIKIQYIKDNQDHYYIPDFLVFKDKEYVIEMKGFDWDGDTELKNEYAKKLYNYHIFYTINELKKFLIT